MLWSLEASLSRVRPLLSSLCAVSAAPARRRRRNSVKCEATPSRQPLFLSRHIRQRNKSRSCSSVPMYLNACSPGQVSKKLNTQSSKFILVNMAYLRNFAILVLAPASPQTRSFAGGSADARARRMLDAMPRANPVAMRAWQKGLAPPLSPPALRNQNVRERDTD